MEPRKLKIGIARFPYGGNGGCPSEHPDVGTWIGETVPKIKADPRTQDGIWRQCFADTPITMTRNKALLMAREAGVDVLVMVDSDQNPDLYLGEYPSAKPFWDSSFDFLYKHYDHGPCVIGAPYCGPSPHPTKGGGENVYVFRWEHDSNDSQLRSFKLGQFTRTEAAECFGIMEVAALPTGMCMVDMRVCDKLTPPWFSYEWEDQYEAQKSTTEDVFFTRNCSMLGMKQYCNWDAWAGHSKPAVVGKPVSLTSDHIREEFKKAVLDNRHSLLGTIELNPGKSPSEIAADLGSRVTLAEPSEIEEVIAEVGTEEASDQSWVGLAEWLEGMGLKLIPCKNSAHVLRWGQMTPANDLAVLKDLVQKVVSECNGNPVRLLEIGSWVGESALTMVDALGSHEGKVHCVDTWKGTPTDHTGLLCDAVGGEDMLYEYFAANVKDLLGSVIIPHRGLSVDQAAEWTKFCQPELDLIFIDGDHSYEGVKSDIQAWLPHVRQGGIICGHDYDMIIKGTNEPRFPGIKKAVYELLGNCKVNGTVWWTRVNRHDHGENVDQIIRELSDKQKRDGDSWMSIDSSVPIKTDVQETADAIVAARE